MRETFSYSWSSSSSRSSVSHRGRREGCFGIPRKCLCGGDVELHTAHTGADPRRRFYTCSSNTMDGHHHIRMWWDEAMMDEVNELIENVDDMSNRIRLECEENLVRLNNFVSSPEMEIIRLNLPKVVDEIEQLKATFGDGDLLEKIKEMAKGNDLPRKSEDNVLQFKIDVVVGLVVILMALILCFVK